MSIQNLGVRTEQLFPSPSTDQLPLQDQVHPWLELMGLLPDCVASLRMSSNEQIVRLFGGDQPVIHVVSSKSGAAFEVLRNSHELLDFARALATSGAHEAAGRLALAIATSPATSSDDQADAMTTLRTWVASSESQWEGSLIQAAAEQDAALTACGVLTGDDTDPWMGLCQSHDVTPSHQLVQSKTSQTATKVIAEQMARIDLLGSASVMKTLARLHESLLHSENYGMASKVLATLDSLVNAQSAASAAARKKRILELAATSVLHLTANAKTDLPSGELPPPSAIVLHDDTVARGWIAEKIDEHDFNINQDSVAPNFYVVEQDIEDIDRYRESRDLYENLLGEWYEESGKTTQPETAATQRGIEPDSRIEISNDDRDEGIHPQAKFTMDDAEKVLLNESMIGATSSALDDVLMAIESSARSGNLNINQCRENANILLLAAAWSPPTILNLVKLGACDLNGQVALLMKEYQSIAEEKEQEVWGQAIRALESTARS